LSENLLTELKKLQGKPLHTLDQGKPFDVAEVSSKEIVLTISTGKSRPVPFWKFQEAWNHLEKYKTLSLVEIRSLKISNFHPTYIAAVIANIPRVKFRKRPILLLLTNE